MTHRKRSSSQRRKRSRRLSVSGGSRLLAWLALRRDEERAKKQTHPKFEARIGHGGKIKAFTEAINYVKQCGTLSLSVSVERDDTIPAFGALTTYKDDDGLVILLNVESIMWPEVYGEDDEVIPQNHEARKRLLITTLMHEFGHALETHLRLPVNEEHIEKSCYEWDEVFRTETEKPDGANAEVRHARSEGGTAPSVEGGNKYRPGPER